MRGPSFLTTALTVLLWAAPESWAADGFRRGDSNADAQFDLSDPVYTLGFLFLGTRTPSCEDAADSNDDGALDLSDAVHSLGFLFLGGPAPPGPFSACGADPTQDALDCVAFPSCGPLPNPVVEAAVAPGGASIEASGAAGDAAVTFDPGIFTRPTLVRVEVAEEPAPLLDSPEAPILPVVKLSFDGTHLDPTGEENGITVRLDPRSTPGGAPFEDAVVFFRCGSHEFFYILPVESAAGEGGGAIVASPAVVRISSALFNQLHDRYLVGQEFVVDSANAVIADVERSGRVIIALGEQAVDGTIEYFEEQGRAVVQFVYDGLERIYETEFLPGVSIEIGWGAAKEFYQCATTTIATLVGPGKLYRVSFPDLSLTEVDGPEELEGTEPLVLVHGWEVFDPIREMLDLTGAGILWRAYVAPRNEDDVTDKVKAYWASVLEYLKTHQVQDVYVYTYNTFLSVNRATHLLGVPVLPPNHESFANKLRDAFDWEDPTQPITIVAHSMGGLLTACALDHQFNLQNPIPNNIRLITLDTPFRGSPFANREFQGYFLSRGLRAVLDAAGSVRPTLDLLAQARMVLEALGGMATALAFLATSTPGARDLDLDALWSTVGKRGLDGRMLAVGGVMGPSGHPIEYHITRSLLDSYPDQLGRRPYAVSDGIVPLASSFRRAGAIGQVWFSGTPTVTERYLSGEDHSSVAERTAVFAGLGLLGEFRRGDINGDNRFDFGDLIRFLNYLYIDGAPPRNCAGGAEIEAADVNDNEYVTAADFFYLQGFLVRGQDALGLYSSPDPGPCRVDSTSTTRGFDQADPAYAVRASAPRVNGLEVEVDIEIESPVPVWGLTLVMEHPLSMRLLEFSVPSMEQEPDGGGAGLNGVLVLSAWRPWEQLIPGTGGDFVHLGTVRFALLDPGAQVNTDWIPEVEVDGVLYRATVFGEDSIDHHPLLLTQE
jgi:pimeloyl-ACP methyl ester carboxylesterase